MKNVLPQLASEMRIDILKMIYAAQSGHPGSSFSIIDLLTTLYFGGFVKTFPKNPRSPERDYCILSKGHACPALYAVLGRLGFFSAEEFFGLRQVDSLLQGHPEVSIPGIEIANGPLGQGLSVANGIALALRLDGKKNRVFSLHGDGELQEGNIWEAAMTSSKYHLENLTVIVDNNGLQIDGSNEEVMPVESISEKFRAFGFSVLEMNGHDFDEMEKTIQKAMSTVGRPTAIVAHTVKGKGVSFMENQVSWHGKAPNDEEYSRALQELEAVLSPQ